MTFGHPVCASACCRIAGWYLFAWLPRPAPRQPPQSQLRGIIAASGA